MFCFAILVTVITLNGIFTGTTTPSTSPVRQLPNLPEKYTTSIEVKTHWKGQFIVYISKEHRDGQKHAMYFQTLNPGQNESTSQPSLNSKNNNNTNLNTIKKYHPSQMAVFFDFDQGVSRGVDVTGGRKICRWVGNTSRFVKDVEKQARHPGALTSQLFGDTKLNNYTFMGPSTIRNLRYVYLQQKNNYYGVVSTRLLVLTGITCLFFNINFAFVYFVYFKILSKIEIELKKDHF